MSCAGQLSILLHKLLWCSISLLWKNDILDIWVDFEEISGNHFQIFLFEWLDGLQGFHLEQVWPHKNFYFLVKKKLRLLKFYLEANNSSPFFSKIVRVRASNLFRLLIVNPPQLLLLALRAQIRYVETVDMCVSDYLNKRIRWTNQKLSQWKTC